MDRGYTEREIGRNSAEAILTMAIIQIGDLCQYKESLQRADTALFRYQMQQQQRRRPEKISLAHAVWKDYSFHAIVNTRPELSDHAVQIVTDYIYTKVIDPLDCTIFGLNFTGELDVITGILDPFRNSKSSKGLVSFIKTYLEALIKDDLIVIRR